MWPGGVRVRVVTLPGDVVDVEVVPGFDAHGVVDEAQDDVFLEHLGRLATTEIRSAPVLCVPVDVVDPVRRNTAASRYPPRTEPHAARGTFEDPAPQQVGRRREQAYRGERVDEFDWGVGRRHRWSGIRAEVHADDRALVGTRPPQRIPVVPVDARQAQVVRAGRERHRVAALGGHPAHLGRGGLGIPHHRQRKRNHPARIGSGPLVDVPVVVGAHHHCRLVTILCSHEQLAAEPGERRKASLIPGAARRWRSCP